MKIFLLVISITVVLFAGIGLYLHELNTLTTHFFDAIDTLQTDLKTNDWIKCENEIYEMENKWNRKKKLLSAFTDHDDLDNIEESLCELKESVKHKNPEESMKAADILRLYFRRMKENESPTWENIL